MEQTSLIQTSKPEKKPAKQPKAARNLDPQNLCSVKPADIENVYERYALAFQQAAIREYGNLAPPLTASLVKNGGIALRQACSIDGFELTEIVAALRWALYDNFWSKNMRSLAVLRKPMRNGLTKLQSIMIAYRERNSRMARGGVPCN